MLHRHAIRDADWDRIEHLLPGQAGPHGGVARDNRRCVDAVLYVARTGVAWQDLPERLGNGNSQWRRFDRRAAKGRWDPILAARRDPALDVLVLDSTVIRAHPCAADAKTSGTGLAAKTIRRLAAAGAASGPRFTGASTVSATRRTEAHGRPGVGHRPGADPVGRPRAGSGDRGQGV
jgi:transposase